MDENDSRYRALVSGRNVLLRIVPLREFMKDGYVRFVGNDP